MNACKLFNRLDFDEDFPGDYQIRAITLLKRFAFKANQYRLLAFNLDSLSSQ